LEIFSIVATPYTTEATFFRSMSCKLTSDHTLTVSANKGQSTLAKDDIARRGCRMQKKYCPHLLSYSPGGTTYREVGPAGCIWGAILGKYVVGVSDGTVRKSDGIFLQALYCDHCANHSATICHRMFPTLKSKGSGSLWGSI